MRAYDISIALVTRNRPASMERCLRSLFGQDARPFEVIVSDDSDPQQAPATEALARRFGCTYTRGPRRGLYANRNHAALQCTGTHIRTMDDDHEFPPGHLAAIQQAVAQDPVSIWTLGEYYPWQSDRSGPPGCPGQLNARGFSYHPPDTQNCWVISDGATIYPRGIFDRGERYADHFKFGISYLEFGARLYWRGDRVRYLPTTYVLHHADDTNRSFMDDEMNLSARVFAMLCFSMVYQTTWKHRLLTWLEINKERWRHGAMACRATEAGKAAFADHLATLNSPAAIAAGATGGDHAANGPAFDRLVQPIADSSGGE